MEEFDEDLPTPSPQRFEFRVDDDGFTILWSLIPRLVVIGLIIVQAGVTCGITSPGSCVPSLSSLMDNPYTIAAVVVAILQVVEIHAILNHAVQKAAEMGYGILSWGPAIFLYLALWIALMVSPAMSWNRNGGLVAAAALTACWQLLSVYNLWGNNGTRLRHEKKLFALLVIAILSVCETISYAGIKIAFVQQENRLASVLLEVAIATTLGVYVAVLLPVLREVRRLTYVHTPDALMD